MKYFVLSRGVYETPRATGLIRFLPYENLMWAGQEDKVSLWNITGSEASSAGEGMQAGSPERLVNVIGSESLTNIGAGIWETPALDISSGKAPVSSKSKLWTAAADIWRNPETRQITPPEWKMSGGLISEPLYSNEATGGGGETLYGIPKGGDNSITLSTGDIGENNRVLPSKTTWEEIFQTFFIEGQTVNAQMPESAGALQPTMVREKNKLSILAASNSDGAGKEKLLGTDLNRRIAESPVLAAFMSWSNTDGKIQPMVIEGQSKFPASAALYSDGAGKEKPWGSAVNGRIAESPVLAAYMAGSSSGRTIQLMTIKGQSELTNLFASYSDEAGKEKLLRTAANGRIAESPALAAHMPLSTADGAIQSMAFEGQSKFSASSALYAKGAWKEKLLGTAVNGRIAESPAFAAYMAGSESGRDLRLMTIEEQSKIMAYTIPYMDKIKGTDVSKVLPRILSNGVVEVREPAVGWKENKVGDVRNTAAISNKVFHITSSLYNFSKEPNIWENMSVKSIEYLSEGISGMYSSEYSKDQISYDEAALIRQLAMDSLPAVTEEKETAEHKRYSYGDREYYGMFQEKEMSRNEISLDTILSGITDAVNQALDIMTEGKHG